MDGRGARGVLREWRPQSAGDAQAAAGSSPRGGPIRAATHRPGSSQPLAGAVSQLLRDSDGGFQAAARRERAPATGPTASGCPATADGLRGRVPCAWARERVPGVPGGAGRCWPEHGGSLELHTASLELHTAPDRSGASQSLTRPLAQLLRDLDLRLQAAARHERSDATRGATAIGCRAADDLRGTGACVGLRLIPDGRSPGCRATADGLRSRVPCAWARERIPGVSGGAGRCWPEHGGSLELHTASLELHTAPDRSGASQSLTRPLAQLLRDLDLRLQAAARHERSDATRGATAIGCRAADDLRGTGACASLSWYGGPNTRSKLPG